MLQRALLLVFVATALSSSLVFASAAAEGEKLSSTCIACHTKDAKSQINPIISGQHEKYLDSSLELYAEGKRPDSNGMDKIAAGYDADQRAHLAAYFAEQDWINTPFAPADVAVDDKVVKRCKGCHGANGEGRARMPRLAGQHPDYLFSTLMDYKTGKRTDRLMTLVKKYDEATLKQLADYYASLK